jgi:ketosteroid isomerase-like protein
MVMTQRVVILCLVASLAILMACQAGGTNSAADATSNANTNTNAAKPATAAPADATAVADEIRTLLQQHDKALSEKNIDNLLATFSSDPNTVVLGTGSEEKWVGPAEIKTAYTEMFKDYDPGTMQCTCDWRTGGADEGKTMAWMAAVCPCKDSMGGKTREYKLNVTATVEKQNGQWKFVSLHMSNAFMPPVTK